MRLVLHIAAAIGGVVLALASVMGLCFVNTAPQQQPANAPPPAAPVVIEAMTLPSSSPPDVSPLDLEPREPPLKSLDAQGLAELLGGPEVAAALRNPNKVTAALLSPKLGAPPADFALRTPEVDVPSLVAARFAELLLNPARNHQIDARKPCVLRYGLKMTFDRGDDRAIAWVCFECAIVTIELDGQVVGGSHIDYIEYDLLLAALAIFPGDEKLAGLRNEFRKRHERRLAFGERQELGASRPATMDDVMRGFGGEATLAALRHPERVEAALLKRPEPLRYVPANEYQDAGEPVTVPVDVTGEILVRLLAPESYTINLDGSAKGCFPVYGVRMTFFGGGSKVDLYFCLGCAHLAIYAQGVAIGGLDIGSICKPLAQEFAKLFPDNAELAGLAGVAGQFPRENARGGLPTFAPAP